MSRNLLVQIFTRDSLGICATLSIAAYMLNLQAEFQKHTTRLVLDHIWTVGGLLKLMDREAIPSSTLLNAILEMEKQRDEMRKEFTHILNEFHLQYCRSRCQDSEQVIASIEASMTKDRQHKPLLGFETVTIRATLNRIRNVNLPHTRSYAGHAHLGTDDSMTMLRSACDAVAKRCFGICLNCLRDGKGTSKTCTKHTDS